MKQRLLIALLSFLIVGICSGKSLAAEYGFGKSILATSGASTYSLGQRSIATKGKNVYIVTGYGNIMFIKSTDGGKTFKAPIEIGGGYNPSIALGKDGTIYAVSSAGDGGTGIMKSTDDGESFSPPTYVTGSGGNFANVTVDDNGDVYVASAGYVGFGIFKSTDGGSTFVELNFPLAYYDNSPAITAKGGALYVTWVGGDGYLYFAKSTGGTSFSNRVQVSENLGYGTSIIWGDSGPSIAGDNDSNVYIAWIDQEAITDERGNVAYQKNLFIGISTNKGDTFVVKRIDTKGDMPQSPSITADAGGNVYLSWQVTQGIGTDIFFTMSDTGDTFLPPIRVSGGMYPTIAVNNAQDALVAWSSEGSVYISKSSHCTD